MKTTIILLIILSLFPFNLSAFQSGKMALNLNGTDAFVHVEMGNYDYTHFTLELWLKVPDYDKNVQYISYIEL